MALPKEKLAHALTVKKKIMETPDACSLVFEIPKEEQHRFAYKPGQFVTLFLEVNGEEISRSYSLSSSPIVDDNFQVTVKRVDDGRASNYLIDHIQQGDTVYVTLPSGSFFAPPKDFGPRLYFLFAGGSGITPVYSILKSVLMINDDNKVVLVYANSTEQDIIFKNELDGWQSQFGERLRTIHVLSRPQGSWTGYSGRCNQELLNKILDEEEQNTRLKPNYYLCGPVGLMELVRNTLFSRNVAKDAIQVESFGEPFSLQSETDATPSPSATEADDDGVYIGEAPSEKQQPQQIEAILDGEDISVDADADQPILETLMEAGYDPAFSCMDGTCMTCMGKVEKGQVYQEDPGILTDENIDEGEALTCQAKPVSGTVRVNYDDL